MSLTFKLNKGFSLVELMVTIAIMVIITGVVVSGTNNSRDIQTLNGLMNTLSLDIRQMQVYGVSVREYSPGTNEFNDEYGVYTALTAGQILGSPVYGSTFYETFVDRDNNGIANDLCSSGPGYECLSYVSLPTGYTIGACRIPLVGQENCALGTVSVTFLRPSITARILLTDSNGTLISPVGLKGVRLKITPANPSLPSKSVIIYTTGQISIQ